MEIWRTLEKDPLFQHTDKSMSAEELKRLSAVRVKTFLKYDILQRYAKEKSYTYKVILYF